MIKWKILNQLYRIERRSKQQFAMSDILSRLDLPGGSLLPSTVNHLPWGDTVTHSTIIYLILVLSLSMYQELGAQGWQAWIISSRALHFNIKTGTWMTTMWKLNSYNERLDKLLLNWEILDVRLYEEALQSSMWIWTLMLLRVNDGWSWGLDGASARFPKPDDFRLLKKKRGTLH